ncbi:MAG TPA: hypothetical protein VHM00_06680 [Caldimonas sp.]|jgi:hypothetical protein|nr:hypothetical protein [Caldimonas sp.]HEX2540752.1 hypothetical protein [Caldimonas sp.]
MSEESKAAKQDPTGHYGPGYGDPVKHLGEKPPVATSAETSGETSGEPGVPLTPGPTLPPQGVPGGPGVDADAAGEQPPLRSEDVSVPPPDHVGEDAPASENAGLIFERS